MVDVQYLEVDTVYHIGTLQADDLGRNSGLRSLEGKCLSVSVSPHAWQRIARLGGYDLCELQCQGGRFVNMLELNKEADAIIEWGIGEKLVELAPLFKAWTFDDELEEWVYTLFQDQDEALEEVDPSAEYDDLDDIPAPDGHCAVENVNVPIGTPLLEEVVGAVTRPDEDATDYLMMAYSMKNTDADGVWWDENYDPMMLSAPRGGIFPNKVERWEIKNVMWSEVTDRESLFDHVSTPQI